MPVKHLSRLLTILAMMVAQFGMLSGHALAETQQAQMSAASGHCAEMAGDHEAPPNEDAPGTDVDCRIACSCIPAAGAEPASAELHDHSPTDTPIILGVRAPNPAADPPPPRLSGSIERACGR
jgi:hypothetical protein